jgi:hypothetical protein
MRYVIGFIVGVVLTIGGAAIYDNMGPGADKPLVNWTAVNDLQKTSLAYVKEQFDRLAKGIGIN